MHTTDISAWKHEHNFTDDTSSAEKRTRRVVVLTGAMMLIEIVAGYFFHSMALMADGCHRFVDHRLAHCG
jgi:Co/Zn/Cd efflux system component